MTGRKSEVETSQAEWRRTRQTMIEQRTELVHVAAAIYPDLTIIDGTDLLVPSRWLPTDPIPLEDVTLSWRPDTPFDGLTGREDITSHLRPLRSDGERYGTYAEAFGDLMSPTVYENRCLYRLVDADLASRNQLTFGRGRYFDALNVGEAAGHEYAAQGAGPFRGAVGDPTDSTRRCIGLAISTLTVRFDRVTGDATFLLHWRDPAKVAHAGGMFQVLPVGVFQPSSDDPGNEAADFDLWRNIVREFNEELLGGSEDYGNGGTIDYDELPAYAKLIAGRRAGMVRAYVLGLGVDPLTMAADLLTIVVIDAPVFDELFGGLGENNDEGRVLSTLDDGTVGTVGIPFVEQIIDRYVHDEPVQAAGAATLQLAWNHRHALLA